MKNILVDALRQSQGDNSSEDSSASIDIDETTSELGATANEDHVAGPLDLELLESTGQVLAVMAADGAGEGDLGDVAGVYPQLNVEDFDNGATDNNAPGDGQPEASRILATNRATNGRRGMALLGFYSPLLCLLCAFAATGSYFVYQKVAGHFDAASISPLHDRTRLSDLRSDAELTQFGGSQNRFELTRRSRQKSKTPIDPPRDATAGNKVSDARSEITDSAQTAAISQTAEKSFSVAATGEYVSDDAIGTLNDAYLAYERNDYEAAEAGYRRALLIAPMHPNALEGLAAVLIIKGAAEESVQYYEMLLSVDPNNIAAATALLGRQHEFTPADIETQIKQLIQRYPTSAHLHFVLGSSHAAKSRWPDARAAYDKAHRLDAENADYMYNLAVSFEHLGRLREARFFYESALTVMNDNFGMDRSVVAERLSALAQMDAGSSLQ